jgi:oligo-1,6-glucosidase
MPQPWWKSAVVYQVYPRSFADSDGDGIGDLPGLIDRLDHIQALGADVVWVSPFYPSPQADNGYDVSDYQDIDPLFGTLADFDRLVAALHSRGMRLVIDIVVNHTSDEHPWFLESRASTDNPKRDWYIWRPPRQGRAFGEPAAEPNDWTTFFSERAWEPDQRTGQYYLHLFARKQPDLNWDNPAVRQAVFAMLRWWLDRGVDGFRFDVINLVSKAFNPDGTGWFVNGPHIHDYLQEMAREVWAGRSTLSEPLEPLITVGETPGVTTADARLYTDPARGEVDMVFQFEHMGVDAGTGGRYDVRPLDWVRMKQVLARWQEGLAQTGWNSLYWGNHDQPRPVSRYGCDDPATPAYRVASAKALATVLHLQRGTPYVYQGEEIGMANYPFTSIDQIDDVDSRNWARLALARGADPADVLRSLNARSRDHARTPMQWDAGAHAGFTTGTPWLPVNPDHVQVNAAAQAGDPESVFAHYQRLIRLRHELPVVVEGAFTMLLAEHPSVFAYTRAGQDEELLVAANLSSEPVEVDLPDGWDDAEVLVASGTEEPGIPGGSSGMPLGHLAPWAAWVRRRPRRG